MRGTDFGGTMRIPPDKYSTSRTEKLRSEIEEAESPPRPVGRICGESCAAVCTQCGSTACQCPCSADCAEAARALSVEPDQYPIEPAILTLVFEMKRLGLFTPCWSCEGHLGRDGSLWKQPRVWFYCNSTTHVRLLADGLKNLEIDKKLSTRWQVVVTFSEADNPTTAFSIEPALSSDSTMHLAALQRDVTVIARSLETMMTGGAADLKQAMDRPLGRNN